MAYESVTCSGGGDIACAADQPCDTPDMDESTCESQTADYCVPRYIAQCEVAADCGPGFTCETKDFCFCASGMSLESDPDATIEDDCVCETHNRCQVIMTACESDDDCAQDLKCTLNDSGLRFLEPVGGDSSEEWICLPQGGAYWGPTTGRHAVATQAPSDRISWASAGGTSDDGCSTVEGDASLSLVGFLGLVGWFRRRP